MVISTSASSRWQQLNGKRRSFLTRCERYAAYTIPKLCPPESYDQNTDELQHDWQSLGAQAVNHLANKIMLALFAPSRPFFRLDASDQLTEELTRSGVDMTKLPELLAQGEKTAVRELDRLALRPQLYEGIKHAIVTGNFLLVFGKDNIQVHGVRKYCVRRSSTGKVIEGLLAEKMLFDELEQDVQDQLSKYAEYQGAHNLGKEVTLYKWLTRNRDGDMELTQWVDVHQLPKKFNGKWSEVDCPYRFITWDLSSDAHYGTGLVEDYQGDFSCLSKLSEAQVTGAILASEFRWLANPAGMTKPDDLMNSANGAVLPGVEGDVSLVESGKSKDLQVVLNVASEYVTRIGRGFLMGSAVTRDAERVTAEEIRMQANELETAYGGVYSRQAVDLQHPLARWLMKRVGLNKGVVPTIVTGIEALSRQGDLDDFKLFLADVAALGSIPPAVLARLKIDAIVSALAAPRRIVALDYLKSEADLQQEIQQQRAAETAAKVQEIGAQAGADIAVSNGTQTQA